MIVTVIVVILITIWYSLDTVCVLTNRLPPHLAQGVMFNHQLIRVGSYTCINTFSTQGVMRQVLSIILTWHRRKPRCKQVSILTMTTFSNREKEPGIRARQYGSRVTTFNTTNLLPRYQLASMPKASPDMSTGYAMQIPGPHTVLSD